MRPSPPCTPQPHSPVSVALHEEGREEERDEQRYGDDHQRDERPEQPHLPPGVLQVQVAGWKQALHGHAQEAVRRRLGQQVEGDAADRFQGRFGVVVRHGGGEGLELGVRWTGTGTVRVHEDVRVR